MGASRNDRRATARRGGVGRTAGLALTLLVAAAAALPAQGLDRRGLGTTRDGTWRDTTYIDAIIRLDIENGPSAVMPALTYASKLMLPVRQFFRMAEIAVPAFALRDSAVATIQPGAVRLFFKPDTKTILRNAARVAYDTLDMVWWDGDLFVATDVLDSLLGVSTGVDWASLSAIVAHATDLPVVARMRRERRRQLLGVQRPSPNVLDLSLRQRAVDGAVGSWTFTASANGPSEQASLELGLGAGLMGGSAELRPVFYTANGATGTDLRWSWSRNWDEKHPVRQLRVGDVPTAGLKSRLVEGLVVTNAPFIRSSEFDVEHLVTNVPAGWEAELYEGGRLLAYSDQEAVGSFRVPLQLGYGQNPFEVVLYGPGGQTIRQARTIRVPFSRLPAGRFEYAAAAGQCRYDPCDQVVSADARYGLSSRVTLQGGWDAFYDHNAAPLYQPYAVVSGALLPALALTGEQVVNDHTRLSANFEPSLDLRASGAFTHYQPGGARLTGAVAEANRSEASLFWRPGWMAGSLILQGNGVISHGPSLHRNLVRLSGTTRVGRIRYSFGVLSDRFNNGALSRINHFTLDGGADAFINGPWRWLRASTVQGQIAVEPSVGLSALRGAIGRNISRAIRLDAALGWLRGSGLGLELGFNTTLPGPRAGARSRVTTEAGSGALLYSSGSIAYDPRTRQTRLSELADVGRAGISGVLFRDDNGNGRKDPGEPGLGGIPVRIGGLPAQTDAEGRFSAWGMYPSEPLQIDVDTLSFSNPQLVLPAPVMRVRPMPNAFGAVAVPVVVGAEVTGYVMLGNAPVPGIPVVLRELNTGREITTLSFSDGGFYRGAVPPGEYEVTLPDAVLERLGVTAPPLSIFVPPGAGEKRYTDLQLKLEPRQ